MKNLESRINNSALKIAFFLLSCALCLLSGCQSSMQNTQTTFPKELAGDWKAEGSPWVISFDDNGQAVSAVHHMTGALIKPMQETVVPFDPSKIAGEQVYNCGPWDMMYDPKSRTLSLRIVIDYRTQNSPAVIMGGIEEELSGSFNEDFLVWNADWYSTMEFVVIDPITGKSIERTTSDDEHYRGVLTFRRVENQ